MKCLNCRSEINEDHKFCPYCGQQVDGNNLRLFALFKEFFENYVSFDTRIGRSIWPFFFKPGKLTREFNEGKRKNYANPFRLYVFCSLIFFTSISLNIGNVKDIIKVSETNLNNGIQLSPNQVDSLNKYLKNTTIEKMNRFGETAEFNSIFDELSHADQNQIVDILEDTNGMNLTLKPKQEEVLMPSDNNKVDVDLNSTMFGKIDWAYLKEIRYDRTISDSMVYKKMNFGVNDYLVSRTYYQIIKVYRSDQKSFAKFLFKNLSFAMFFVVPISAFILLLLFGWKRRHYVEYLIYSIHVHSLLFFVAGMLSLTNYIFEFSTTININMAIFTMLYGVVYYLLGLYKLYQKGVLSTLWRAFFSFFFYNLAFVIISLLEFYASFLLY